MANHDGPTEPNDSIATRVESDLPTEMRELDRSSSIPDRIGRHRVVKLLGEGGFGRVYLAHDDDLDRPVAIKVPRPDRISRPEDVEAYLTEARTLARLDHPGIVPVYEVGRTEEGHCFIVSKFVEGIDLAGRLRLGSITCREAAELVATVAEALHYAHSHHLVHRDVKPANILIDASGRAYLADFGLALKDEDFGKGSGFAGTPSYMSPEQARGEGHRVDGRSDVFGLGVVFYELLTGRRPFQGDSVQEVMDKIAESDARPPRQFVDSIPREVERICLKALAKRATERFSTAGDMAEDLRHFLRSGEIQSPSPNNQAPTQLSPPPAPTWEATPPTPTSGGPDSDPRPIKIVPKGLRSFDEHDADFFLELLPGPRDRDGLPEGLRSWKTRIEILDPDKTFKVGMIYGPSGCGKSSMVKAGLIPRLAKHIRPVYIESTPEETEPRLLRGLRKVCPELPPSSGLIDSVASIRRGRFLGKGQKILLVLDQFEQWLSSREGLGKAELVAALRQCDGEHVQAIVMVRDDFWLAASRFMRDLEIRLIEDENSALVDLFDHRHAIKVLTAFGRSFEDLPRPPEDLTKGQRTFLDRAISGLVVENKVNPVKLALFAEMVKGKPWSPETLGKIGGIAGIGVAFLEGTFGRSSSRPEYRLHEEAARNVLAILLPKVGADIRGHMQPQEVLLGASGYRSKSEQFRDLIRILDGELRLITPTDPDGMEFDSTGRTTKPGRRYFQLTHDYLVPSLRDWLSTEQRKTLRGRAKLRLIERSSLWAATRSKYSLPNLYELIYFRFMTNRRRWSIEERQMMSLAFLDQSRKVGFKLFIYVLVLSMITFIGSAILDSKGLGEAKGLIIMGVILVLISFMAVSGLVAFARWVSGVNRGRRTQKS